MITVAVEEFQELALLEIASIAARIEGCSPMSGWGIPSHPLVKEPRFQGFAWFGCTWAMHRLLHRPKE